MTIGIDAFSGNGVIDWNRAMANGNLGFAGLRACEAAKPDSRFLQYRKECDARHIPSFAYMLLRWEQNGPSPEDQGKCLLDMVSKEGGDSEYELTPVIDLEFEGSRKQYGITAGQALEWFLRCYTTVKAGLGGADPGTYTSNVVWTDPDGMNDLPCPEILGSWSWMKYWPYAVGSPAVYDRATVDALHDPIVAPPFAGAWVIHQYMGDAVHYPGVGNEVDMDRTRVVKQGDHNGTVAWVQRKLKIPVDGIFGPQTLAAVKAFQSHMHIDIDGLVGLQTFSCLSHVIA